MSDVIIPTDVPVEGTPAPAVETPPEVVLPSDETPFAMPEKFEGKTAEEIAKSYLKLEALKAKDETPPKEENETPPKDDATTTADLIEEYASRGTDLTEEDYTTLEEKGYSRKQVDIYKAGVEAQTQAKTLATMEKAGTTSEEASNAANWARDNWPAERVASFNDAISNADESVQVQMLQMLTEQFRTNDTKPQNNGPVHAQNSPAPATQGYESMEQLVADQSDPRYDSRSFRYDPAYYKAVRDKAGRSSL